MMVLEIAIHADAEPALQGCSDQDASGVLRRGCAVVEITVAADCY